MKRFLTGTTTPDVAPGEKRIKAQAKIVSSKNVRGVQYYRILIDGYYGSHELMNKDAMRVAVAALRHLIEEVWRLPWDRIIWISLSGAWMKALPLYMMQLGLGHSVEFYLPCQYAETPTDYILQSSSHGKLLKDSLNHMRVRLQQREGPTIEVLSVTQQMKSLATHLNRDPADKRVFIMPGNCFFSTNNKVRDARLTHVVHFPFWIPGQIRNEQIEASSYGGYSYTRFEGRPENRAQFNLFDLCTAPTPADEQ